MASSAYPPHRCTCLPGQECDADKAWRLAQGLHRPGQSAPRPHTERIYRARFRGVLIHTSFAPATVREVQALIAAGWPREAIAQATGVPYPSVTYVGHLEPFDHEKERL